MSTPRDRRRAEQRRAHRGTVITALSNALPDQPDLDISLMLDTVRAATGIPLGQLAEHLACHPDALISGDPRCPVVLIRLTHALHDAGQPVVRPGCAGCGKLTLNLAQCGSDGLLCQMCRVRTRLSTCARCGRENTRIAARRAEGGICNPCYRVDPGVVEECGGCGRTRMPVTRRGDGTALCLGCWTPPVHRCIHCGQDRPARVSGPDGSICRDCYRQRPRRCGRCGRVRVISKRATHDNPDLCGACNRGPDMPCAGCGQTRPSRRYRPDATWLCQTCKPRISEACCRCGRIKPVHARWPLGPLCTTCHNTLLDAPGECAHCHEIHVLVALDQQGASTCGPCAGIALDPRCAACARPGRHYLPGRCSHCVLDERLAELLSGPDGAVPPQLQPLGQALAMAQHPRSLISWLQRSPNARLLAQLAATGTPLSHELLDELPPGRHECYVRQMLVHTGVLPERHDDLDRLPRWLDSVLASKPGAHARLVRPFVHWFLLRRARRRAAARRQPAMAGSYLRTRITVALELLAWLDEQHLPLAQLDQATLDAWLARGNTSSYTIRYFLDWAGDRGITGSLTVPALSRSDPGRILDETQRWDLLRRCLTDDTMPLDTRAAAALVLLFGLPLSRIRHLTLDQLDITDTRSFLRTGRHPLLLPPRLAALLQRLVDTPLTRARLATTAGGRSPRWLFPGLTPGRPISQAGFQSKLRAHDIDTRPARNAALISLAGDLPSTVLADVLGLSTGTAVYWAGLAKRDWAAYVAERAADTRPDAGRGNSARPE